LNRICWALFIHVVHLYLYSYINLLRCTDLLNHFSQVRFKLIEFTERVLVKLPILIRKKANNQPFIDH
ncbi:MAG: hypothetical protein RPT25_13260, partial [Cycloclasticus sp.]